MENNIKIDVIKELPKEWDFFHKIFSYKENDEEIASIMYVPAIEGIVVYSHSIMKRVFKNGTYSIKEFRCDDHFVSKNRILADITYADFLVFNPSEIVEEYKKNLFELLDYINENEEKFKEVPLKKLSEEEEILKLEKYMSDFAPMSVLNRLIEVSHIFKGLKETNENFLPDFYCSIGKKEYENDMYVKLYRDSDNHFHVLVKNTMWYLTIPLAYSKEEAAESLKSIESVYYESSTLKLIAYYKFITFKRRIKYYNVFEDVSMYSLSITYKKEDSGISLIIEDEEYLQLRIYPVDYMLETFYSVKLLYNFPYQDCSNNEYFLMNKPSLANLIDFLLGNTKFDIQRQLKIYKLIDFCDNISEKCELRKIIDTGSGYMLNNVIEVKFYSDTNEYTYVSYRDNIRREIKLDYNTVASVFYNTKDVIAMEESYYLKEYLKEKEVKDIPLYIESLLSIKKYQPE